MWLEKLTENHKLGALCIQKHQSLLKEFTLFYFFLRIKVSCEYKRESNFQKKVWPYKHNYHSAWSSFCSKGNREKVLILLSFSRASLKNGKSPRAALGDGDADPTPIQTMPCPRTQQRGSKL